MVRSLKVSKVDNQAHGLICSSSLTKKQKNGRTQLKNPMSRDELDFVATKLVYEKCSNLMLEGQVSLIMDGSAFRKL